MRNKEKRSFLFILPLGFGLTEVIAPSAFLPVLLPKRNDGTLSDVSNFNRFTHVVTNYNNQEPLTYNTVICGLVLCECRV